MNAINGKLYRGVNALMLSWIADDRGYQDPRWCTYKQAQDKGWQVKKGAKAANVEYWAYYDLKAKKLLPWKEVQILVKQDPEYAQKNLLLTCRKRNDLSIIRNFSVGSIRAILFKTDLKKLKKGE